MKHNQQRDAVIALGGMVVGLVISAATLLPSRDLSAALSGGVLQDPRNNFTDVLPRAEVLRRTRATSYKAASSMNSSTSSEAVPAADPLPARDCVVAREVAGSFLLSIEQFVPKNVENTGMIAGLQAVALQYLDKYCPATLPAPASSSSSVQASTRSVDNACDGYNKLSDRYTTCKAKELKGIRY